MQRAKTPTKELSKSLLALKFMSRTDQTQESETAATAFASAEHWVVPTKATPTYASFAGWFFFVVN